MSERKRQKHQKSEEIEKLILDWNADAVPIVEMVRRLDAMDEHMSRQTIYNILGRYGVRRSKADLRFKLIREDAFKLTKLMLRFTNGGVDRTTLLESMSEFEARWAKG